MTTPTDSTAYPSTPSAPSSSPAGYTTPTGAPAQTAPPIDAQQVEALRGSLIETILREVVRALVGFFIPGAGPAFDQLASWAVTLPLEIIQLLTGPVTSISTGLVQVVIDAIVSGLTGGTSGGNDPTAIALALIQQAVAIPTGLFDQLFGLLAALTGQVTAIQNNPAGASQTDDFAVVSLTAWTNVLNSLAISSGIIRTTTIAAAYIGTTGTPRKPNTDRHGVQIVVDGKMRGAVRAWICGDATMSNYAGVEIYSGFDGDAARIVTGSSPSLTVVQKQVDFIDAPVLGSGNSAATPISVRVQPLTAFDIRYDPTSNTFSVLRNGVAAIQWVDSANIVTHGSGKRLVGVVANAFNTATVGANGYGIKKVTFYDW